MLLLIYFITNIIRCPPTYYKSPQSAAVKFNSMIFKTFNSDIDKISSNWGMFGRSFNDIGTAIIGRITDICNAFQATDDLIGSFKDSDSIWKRLYPGKESIKSQLIEIGRAHV